MRFNTLGQACMGVGDGTVSIDRVTIARGGKTKWLNDQTIIYQKTPDIPGSKYTLETYNTRTRLKSLADDRGASDLEAGNNLWAAWNPAGVRTNIKDLDWPDAGLLSVSTNGVLAICPNRQLGKGAEMYYPNNSTIFTVPECISNGARVILGIPGGMVWLDKGKVKASSMEHPNTIAAPNYSPVPIIIPNTFILYLLYQDGQRLLLQPWNEPKGWIVYDKPTTYNPDGIYLRENDQHGNVIRCGWSINPGEGPLALRTKDIDLTSPRVDLRRI